MTKQDVQIGDKFGQLTILQILPRLDKKERRVIAICDCGKEKDYLLKNLKNGTSKSCGCARNITKVGDVFGRLTILERLPEGKVVAQCSCPLRTIKTYFLSNLQTGATSSCECYRKETNIENAKAMNTPEAKEKARLSLQKPEVIEQRKQTNIERYDYDNPLKNPTIRAKCEETIFQTWEVRNAYQIPEVREKAIKGAKSPLAQERREITCQSVHGYKNMLECSAIRQKGHKSLKQENNIPVNKLCEMLTNRRIPFVRELSLIKDGHLWDIVLFKNGVPVLLIDYDGDYYHAINEDPIHTHQTSFYLDVERFSDVEGEVKILILSDLMESEGFEGCIKEIVKLYDQDYNAYITELFEKCNNTPFPYPVFEKDRMLSDFKNLLSLPTPEKYNRNKIPGNSIMTNFHKTIYTSRVGKYPSPSEAWKNEDLLLKCIKNRYIYAHELSKYNIARGFEKNKIAPRVSVFQPSFAKFLLETFAPNTNTVFDPFSGFSGRMLGTIACNRTYTGQDIRQKVVNESNKIINFLNLQDKAQIIQKDSLLTGSDTVYDVLLTCPPYGNKEIWENDKNDFNTTDEYVEFCLKNYKAKIYIFVVDVTEKFIEFKKLETMNRSHFAKSKETVLVFSSLDMIS